jgi:hypothetical protein
MEDKDDKDAAWMMEIVACLEDTPSDSDDDDDDVKMSSHVTILTNASAQSSCRGPRSTMQFPFFGSMDGTTSLQSIPTLSVPHRLDSTVSLPSSNVYPLQKGHSDSSIVSEDTAAPLADEVIKKAKKKDTRTKRNRPKKSEKTQHLKEKLADLIVEYNRRQSPEK